jgi:hypothetical protein
MKAGELNSTHIGKRIHVVTATLTLTDILTAVRHEADLYEERTFFESETSFAIGRRTTELTFMKAHEVGFDPECEVQVADDMEATA